MQIDRDVQTRFSHGSLLEVSTTAAVVSSDAFPCQRGVQLRASPLNTDLIYVGNSPAVTAGINQATDGFPISPGDVIHLSINSLAGVYVIAASGTQAVFFMAF